MENAMREVFGNQQCLLLKKLDNLVAIIDYNKWQGTGRSDEIMHLRPMQAKWKSFGWHVENTNGHNHKIFFRVLKKKIKNRLLSLLIP